MAHTCEHCSLVKPSSCYLSMAVWCPHCNAIVALYSVALLHLVFMDLLVLHHMGHEMEAQCLGLCHFSSYTASDSSGILNSEDAPKLCDYNLESASKA